MGLTDLARGHQQTRDGVASNPSVIPIPKIISESIGVWQEPVVITETDVSNSVETQLQVIPPEGVWNNFLRGTKTNTQGATNNLSSGAIIAGTGSNVDDGQEAWSNPGNITADDSSYASAVVDDGFAGSDWLFASNFGFNIPSVAVITGVEVVISRFADQLFGEDYVIDTDVQLNDGSSFTGDNKAKTGVTWPSSEATATYGGSSDGWNASLSPSQVNSSSFGVGLKATCSLVGNSTTAYVDSVTINIYYSTTSAGLVVSQSTGAIDTANHRVDLDTNDSIHWILSQGNNTYSSVTPVFDEDSSRTNIDFDAEVVQGELFTGDFPFTLGGTDPNAVRLEVSFDGGSSWVEGRNQSLISDGPGGDVRFRITALDDGLYWKTQNSVTEEKPIIMRLG